MVLLILLDVAYSAGLTFGWWIIHGLMLTILPVFLLGDPPVLMLEGSRLVAWA